MANLRITLFGQFRASSESKQLEFHASTGHLLAYLALSSGKLIPRSRIAGTLWPNLLEDRARANLSTSVWRLRQALSRQGVGFEPIRVSDLVVGLDPDFCDVDLDVFRRDCIAFGASANTLDTLARAAHAAELYRGDLLEDWDLDWCRLEREQLRQRYVQTLRALAEGFERFRRYDLALRFASRATEAEPSDEPAQRALIRLLVRSGDKTSAATQYRRFAGYVRSELGVEPDKQTSALLDEIRDSSSSARLEDSLQVRAAPCLGDVPLIGRVEELQQICTLLDASKTGAGSSVLILGEAGIGKSRLADWVMEEWAARGGRMARGRCIEFNDPIPYQPILDAVGSVADLSGMTDFAHWGTSLSPAFRDDGTSDAASEGKKAESSWPVGKLRLFGWLLAKLQAAGRPRPLLIVIEDLQWATAATVDFLAYLVEHARNIGLLVLLTARTSGSKANCDVVQKISRYCTTTMRLGPLDPTETTALVHALLREPPTSPPLAKFIYEETEGNPLFIVETIRLFQQQVNLSAGALKIKTFDGLRGPVLSPRIPDGVRSAVEQRLQLIDSAALRVTRIASVLGRAFDEELLSMVVSTGANRLSKAIDRLLRAGIFEREDAGYRFAHDKIRAVCYEKLPARLRKVYHARAAAALCQMPELSVHRLAWHQDLAGQWSLATASWVRAGDDAMKVHAHEEALNAYQRAIECARRDEELDFEAAAEQKIQLLLRCDKAFGALGRPSDRKKTLDQIDASCDLASRPALRAEWFIRRALLEHHIGNCTSAVGLARKAWGIARQEDDIQLEVEALHVLAQALYRVERFQRSLAVLRLALKRIGHRGSTSKVIVLMHMAAVQSVLGDFESAARNIERARKICIELGLQTEYFQVISWQALVDKWTGNVRGCRSRLAEALRLANEANDAVYAARVTFQLAALDALEGNVGEALRRLRRALVACRALGYARTETFCLNEVAYSVGRLLGNHSWAWHAAARALRLPATLESRYLSWMCRDSQAMVLMEQGRLDDAATAIDDALRLMHCSSTALAPAMSFCESLARRGMIRLAMGDPCRALKDLEAARRTQVQMGHRLLLVDTLTSLGRVYAILGDADSALQLSNDALTLLVEIGYANHQPQRIYWHHYLILEQFNREPRLQYLKQAVELIRTQAATVSKAQALRFQRDVRLNREILEAWEQHRHELQPDAHNESATTLTLAPVTLVSARPAIYSI